MESCPPFIFLLNLVLEVLVMQQEQIKKKNYTNTKWGGQGIIDSMFLY